MPEEEWETDVSFNPDGNGPWFYRKKWRWSVWHWRPDETADCRSGWERTKEKGHRSAVKARLQMENNLHIVTGASSEIYEAARAVVAAYEAGDGTLAQAISSLDAAIERGSMVELP